MQEDWGKALRSLFDMVLEDMADLQQIKKEQREGERNVNVCTFINAQIQDTF